MYNCDFVINSKPNIAMKNFVFYNYFVFFKIYHFPLIHRFALCAHRSLINVRQPAYPEDLPFMYDSLFGRKRNNFSAATRVSSPLDKNGILYQLCG